MKVSHPHPKTRRLVAHEVSDSSAGPDRADSAAAARPTGETHPRLRPARDQHPVRRPGGRDRQGHRGLPAAAPASGVPAVPQAGRPRLPRGRAAPDHGQLRHPQKARGEGLARGQPPDPRALHADLRIVAEPRRGLVRDHRPASHPPRHLRQRQRPQRQIRTFIDSWNDGRAHPFVWTKTAEEILKRADRPKTLDT